MRIAIMALDFAVGQPNSHEAHLPQLVRALVQYDADGKYLLLLRSDNQGCFPKAGGNVEHIVFPRFCRFKILQIFCEQFVVPFVVLFWDADILHFPNNIRPMFISCKSVGTIHWVLTPRLKRSFSLAKRVYFGMLGRRSIEKAERLIVVSRSCRDDLLRYSCVNEEKLDVVYHGISGLEESGKGSWISDISLRPGYVLHVGTSAAYKNLEVLVCAYALARAKYNIKSQLVLVGNVDENEITRMLTKAGRITIGPEIASDVIRTGYVPHSMILSFYKGASMLVSVSLQETFGIALLEAMSIGVPVIASDIAAHREIGGEAAVYVNPWDFEIVAHRIYEVLSNETLRDGLGREGLKRARMFSWERSAVETMCVYQRALGDSSMQGVA